MSYEVRLASHRGKPLALGNLRLIFEPLLGAGVIEPQTLKGPKEVYEFMRPIAAQETVENFWALHVNCSHELLGGAPERITRGTLNSSLSHPREIFRGAIVAGTAAIILVHNHPSGDPTPSSDDRLVTEGLVNASKVLEIPIYDHLILGRERYVSFAECGLL
jgi:DNA repair protein RadC